jgi:hypothetical protein
MDTSAEVVPMPGSNPRIPPLPPKPIASGRSPIVSGGSMPRPHPGRYFETRVSFDPMQATDRYRLVMPYDQRL